MTRLGRNWTPLHYGQTPPSMVIMGWDKARQGRHDRREKKRERLDRTLSKPPQCDSCTTKLIVGAQFWVVHIHIWVLTSSPFAPSPPLNDNGFHRPRYWKLHDEYTPPKTGEPVHCQPSCQAALEVPRRNPWPCYMNTSLAQQGRWFCRVNSYGDPGFIKGGSWTTGLGGSSIESGIGHQFYGLWFISII